VDCGVVIDPVDGVMGPNVDQTDRLIKIRQGDASAYKRRFVIACVPCLEYNSGNGTFS